MKHSTINRPAIELRQVDPSRRRARLYRLAESMSLFGEPGIVITWGRIGRRPRVRFETFVSKAARTRRWQQLLARRAAHGYSPCTSVAPGPVAPAAYALCG